MKKLFALGLVIFSVATLTACSSGDTKSESAPAEDKVEQTTEAKKDDKKTYQIGDAIIFDGEATITIKGTNFTDERNQFDESNPDRVLTITYDVENLSDDDYVIGSEISLYVDGKKMDTYPVNNTINTISAGRSYENATASFGVFGEGEMELEVEPSWSFTAKPQIVKLDVQ
ncbi:hypothetical protein [Streptococcus pacificus]|uniref:DUF4352 domain-containing protein n=1 Tax=Streptococcus pacificus TaxID=2740577 RepID=A0ABS0ZM38_9STRE|nr:hypothetical protein [Streptococcus pacificus]MBJ8326491.1 hypothetical protein [Streptococcus pacificus]